ncbi:amidase signature domain-containing protein [Phycomyces nitens]|nr:amidase signature domain-containing protein [Phycomyces nitens]
MQNTKPSAPELYGWQLLAVTHALEWIPMVADKVAKDALLFSLRGRAFSEIPNTVAIHPKCLYNSAIPEKPLGITLDESQRSISPFLSFWDYHDAYKSHKTTPFEVAQILLAKLEETKQSHWIRSFDKDSILAQAKESTDRYNRGESLGQLDGVFVSIKEEMAIKGFETKCGTSFIHDGQPEEEDSAIVKRLRAAGAIVGCQAVMNELGWDTFSVNPITGTPKNPYISNHSCGGSSGGSGGSVASGLFPISIGADGGGSIRIPSSFCGVYGLKPTCGRISACGGEPVDPTVGVFGPLAATADDLALAYAIIAGPDPNDPLSLHQPPVSLKDYDLTETLAGIRIGVLPDWHSDNSDEIFGERIEQVKAYFEKLGATIVTTSIPDIDLVGVAHSVTICSEMSSYASSQTDTTSRFLPHTRLMMSVSKRLRGSDYVKAQQVRTRLMDQLHELFSGPVDLILTPTTGSQSPAIPPQAAAYGMSHATWTFRAMQYVTLANLTGIPALNVPAGFHNGLPVGLQFMASWWNEALLLRIAKIIERMPGLEKKKADSYIDCLEAL